MIDDARYELKKEFECLKQEMLAFVDNNHQKLPEDMFRVYFFFLKKIDGIIKDLSSENFDSKIIRYAELSRAIIELPPEFFSSKLGGKIINAEKKYISLSR